MLSLKVVNMQTNLTTHLAPLHFFQYKSNMNEMHVKLTKIYVICIWIQKQKNQKKKNTLSRESYQVLNFKASIT